MRFKKFVCLFVFNQKCINYFWFLLEHRAFKIYSVGFYMISKQIFCTYRHIYIRVVKLLVAEYIVAAYISIVKNCPLFVSNYLNLIAV